MANINIGDKVKFLNEVGGGVVSEIVDKYLVKVMTEDEWEIPALKTELIVVEPVQQSEITAKSNEDNNSFITEDNSKNIAEDTKIDTKNISLLLALVSSESDSQNLSKDIYMINDSEFYVFYNMLCNINKEFSYIGAEILEPNTKVLLKQIKNDEMSKLDNFLFQIIFFSKGKYDPLKPFEKKLSMKNLLQSKFIKNDFFDENASLHTIFELKNEAGLSRDEILKLMNKPEKAERNIHNNYKIDYSKERIVFDLHIEELIDNYEELGSTEILRIQMDEFHKGMKKIITEGFKEAIFIHGKGKGILKRQIYTELRSNYKGFSFQDASFREYAYAATLVIAN